MNFASGGILAIGKSIFIDKIWPKYYESKAPKKFDANDNFVFTQAGKTALSATDGLAAIQSASFGAGMVGDLTQFVSNEMIRKYCTKFKGPISGTYKVEFKNEGKTYCNYTLKYEGEISVYCKKTTFEKATIPKLSGYLEGNVTNMNFTDDVWAVEDKSDWNEIKSQRIPAPALPFNASKEDPGFGAAARGVLPGSFYFPLQAQIVQGKMIIRLMPAISDFSPAYTNRSIMVVKAKRSPYNVSGAVFEYPIENANFIITRSLRMKESSPTVTLDIKTTNGVSKLAQSFTRSEAPDASTKVDFAMNIEMSNEQK